MIIQPRTKSYEYRVMSLLHARMVLTAKDKKYYEYLQKGYQGELMFDQLTAKLENDLYIVNGLCLDCNNSEFQIDTFIISQNTLYPFEVKNHQGDYFYESLNFYPRFSKDEIKNPLDQLKRSITLLKPLLKNLGTYLPIEGYVTFVNPNFTLYQAPLNAPIIYPTQLNSFMKTLNEIPSQLDGRHKKLADQLISLHKPKSRYIQLPPFAFDKLQKGLICAVCDSFMMLPVGDKKLVCDHCGSKESVESAVLRCVDEIKLLFPEMKITTNLINEWWNWVKEANRKDSQRKLYFDGFWSMVLL